MAQFSAFAPFGLFDFSSKPSHAETIYRAITGAASLALRPTIGTYAEAKMYATAIALGCARATLERARNQLHPMKAWDKLPTLERNYGIIPDPNASPYQRQSTVAARKLLMAGAREEAVVTDLVALLGAKLIAYRPAKASDRETWPADPKTVGSFPRLDAALVYGVVNEPIGTAGAIPKPYRVTLRENSAEPQPGETITVEPEIDGIAEACVVTAWVPDIVAGSPSKTDGLIYIATTNPHSSGCSFSNATPLWRSTQREVCIIVDASVTTDAETIRKVNEIMARHSKTVTRWEIIAASSTTTTGPFVCGVGTCGVDAIGSAAFVF